MGFPSFNSGEVLTAADMNAVGLWRVTSCTVTSVGGTAATASNGVITVGNGNTSVTVNNAFSSNYANYKIILRVTGSQTGDISMTLGNANTGYAYGLIYATTGAGDPPALINANFTSFYYIGGHSTTESATAIEVFSPNLARPTQVESKYNRLEPGPGYITGTYTGLLNNSNAYTSFTIVPNGGTFTAGLIRVYGYRD